MGTKLDYEKKGRLSDRLDELSRVTKNGTRDYDQVMDALQALIEGKELSAAQIVAMQRFYPARDYGRYDQYLYSLTDQLALLKDLNKRMPRDLQIPRGWFDTVDLSPFGGHKQSVEDLATFHVELGSLEQNWGHAEERIRLTHKVYDTGFARDADNMRLHHLARRYPQPGLYVVRVNLVDHWGGSPDKSRTLDEVSDHVKAANQDLASTEGIEGYGLQDPELYRQQDGENLPYLDCAGIEQGSGFRRAPFSGWGGFGGEVGFGVYGRGNADWFCAAPSLLR